MNKARFSFAWYGFAGSNSRIEGLLDAGMVYPLHRLLVLVADGKIDGAKLQNAIPDLMREDKHDE